MNEMRADRELVIAHTMGDPGALAGIYDRYAARLYDTAAAMLGDRHEAADAMQDVFVVAAEKLGQLRDPDRLGPWLFAVLRHVVYRRTTKRARQRPIDPAAPGSAVAEMVATTDPLAEGASASAEELAALVRAAASGLDSRDQLVLELSVRQGLAGADLADALGVTPEQSHVLVHRMRDRVERSLGALVVARIGRRDCSELAELLRSWDGRFDVLVRKRVARHVERCTTCAATKRRHSVVSLMAIAPVFALPTGLRDLVLGTTAGVGSAAVGAGGAPGADPAPGGPARSGRPSGDHAGADSSGTDLAGTRQRGIDRRDGDPAGIDRAAGSGDDGPPWPAPSTSRDSAPAPTLLPSASALPPIEFDRRGFPSEQPHSRRKVVLAAAAIVVLFGVATTTALVRRDDRSSVTAAESAAPSSLAAVGATSPELAAPEDVTTSEAAEASPQSSTGASTVSPATTEAETVSTAAPTTETTTVVTVPPAPTTTRPAVIVTVPPTPAPAVETTTPPTVPPTAPPTNPPTVPPPADTTPPVVTIVRSVPTLACTWTVDPSVSATVTDASAISSVTVSWSHPVRAITRSAAMTEVQPTSWRGQMAITPSNGTWRWTVTAVDSFGNSGSASGTTVVAGC